METFKYADQVLARAFANESMEAEKKYHLLFSYFMTGFLLYKSKNPSLVIYPGAPSSHGPHIDAMEGFSRMLPLIASWISSGRGHRIQTLTGETVDLEEVVITGLLSGTDPNSSGYWGAFSDKDQKICEAADIALSIWMMRHTVWPKLEIAQKQRIMSWLLSINGKEVSDNNWHLFPVLINEVAMALGYDHDSPGVQAHYSRFKSFYRGDGWFSDGPQNIYDYYNAWGIHYSLFWINRINPEFDPTFIRESLKKFLQNYVYLLSPQGLPILGRSICYRMAASAPLIAAHLQDSDLVDGGLARRAFDSTWNYFIRKGAVCQGKVTQGYCQEDLRFMDHYIGPASCLWALRSLILAFQCPENSSFWTAPARSLPVERGDYKVTIPSIRWTIQGIKATKEITINTGRSGQGVYQINNYTIKQKLAELIDGKSRRPSNKYLKYKLGQYSSREPFCGCK